MKQLGRVPPTIVGRQLPGGGGGGGRPLSQWTMGWMEDGGRLLVEDDVGRGQKEGPIETMVLQGKPPQGVIQSLHSAVPFSRFGHRD